MRTAKSIAKKGLLGAIAAATRRHPVLLPKEAAADSALLDVVAPYRVVGDTLLVLIRERSCGTLRVTLLTAQQPNSWRELWRSPWIACDGPAELRLNVATGGVSVRDRTFGTLPLPLPSRRFSLSVEWRPNHRGPIRSRMTGHYVPGGGAIDGTYFSGANYVDYEAESAGQTTEILELIRQYPFRGASLEIGCATGTLLERLVREGVSAIGVDVSPWAVGQARERVGADRVWHLDVGDETADRVLRERAPFGALIMLAVVEHFSDPFGVLARLTKLVAPGGRLFLTTTNADGIGRRMFGPDWEGYFDWTHYGVDMVSVRSLREGLSRLGWRVNLLETSTMWDCNVDPTHATLREWWASDARFRRLVVEREVGDLITCVATKQ